MAKKLKPVQVHGNQNIVKILNEGADSFNKIIHQYCNENGSSNTILGWGTEKTFLSIFLQGIYKKNRYCFLEIPFLSETKKKGKDKEKFKNRWVDALLIDRSNGSKTLTGILEAKVVWPYINDTITDSKINQTIKALEEAKSQLTDIDREDINWDEENGSDAHIYRIALIFTILKAKFAKSGEGDTLDFEKYKDIQTTATEYFDEISEKINGENILHFEYIHSIPQLKLIKEYYGSEMVEDIDRPSKNTYYDTGVLVTAAIFE